MVKQIELPENSSIGLTIYGHRWKGDFGDIEHIPAAPYNERTHLLPIIQGISPKGKTPIADTLIKVATTGRAGFYFINLPQSWRETQKGTGNPDSICSACQRVVTHRMVIPCEQHVGGASRRTEFEKYYPRPHARHHRYQKSRRSIAGGMDDLLR